MKGDAPVSWLMFFTLIAGLAVITGAFLYFLRSQRNRDIAANALTGDNAPHLGVTANGALTDLIGFGVFALVAMGLLALGYSHKSGYETAQVMPPIGQTTGTAPKVGSTSGPQPVGLADQPKVYQPVNPAPDLRVAPAGSTAGAGPDNGGRPENTTK